MNNQKGFVALVIAGVLLLGIAFCVLAYSTYELQQMENRRPVSTGPQMFPAH